MIINTDINILGSLPDLELIRTYYFETKTDNLGHNANSSYTKIKTERSVKRFGRAIKRTLFTFKNDNVKWLISNILENDTKPDDFHLMLFWNASFNNQLINYLNTQVYFPAYYSGRLVLKTDEVFACLMELKIKSAGLQKWSDKTIETVASKYLTFLRKHNLLEGSLIKKIKHPYLSDLSFINYFYWIIAIEPKSNILDSNWLIYSFTEKDVLIERLLQKKYTKFIDLTYTGDKLTLIPIVDYKNLYDAITRP